MKKIIVAYFLLFFISTLTSVVYASDDISNYRIPNYNTVEEYQQYIGKIITYVPSISTYGDPQDWQNFNNEIKFVRIKSIEGKTKKNEKFQKMEWTIENTDGSNPRNITVYSGDYPKYTRSYKNEYTTTELPLFFLDKWKNDNSSEIGRVFSNPLVKAQYKVIDISYGLKKEKYTMISNYTTLYTVENTITGKQYVYNASDVESECFEEDLSGSFHSYLSKVEKPSNSSIKFGKTTIIEDEKDKGITKFSYSDNFINIVIYGTSTEFYFTLKNVSQSTQKLVWDDAVFVNTTGTSSKVMHNGIKYSQREAPQPASTIIKGALIDDLACPIDNVYYSEIINKWQTKSMYPTIPTKEIKQVSLMLPIQIKDIVNEYIFRFDLKYEYQHPDRLNL